MELDDLNLDIKIEVTSLEELRKIRKEMQKIAQAKKEIQNDKEDSFDDIGIDPSPKDPYDPDYPKFPRKHRWFVCDTKQESGFETGFDVKLDGVEDDVDEFGVDDEAFSTVGQMDQEMFNDRSMR